MTAEHGKTWRDLTPFLSTIGRERSTASQLFVRLAEACVIGAIVMYGTVRTLENDIDGIQQDIREIKSDISRIESDFYKPAL